MIAAAALVIAGLVGASGCTVGCPAALLEGTLVRQADELVVAPDWGGPLERIDWPFGYSLREDDGVLVVTQQFGGFAAREGDRVRLGGGERATGTWGVCGLAELAPLPEP